MWKAYEIFTYMIIELIDAILILWKKHYADPEEEDVNKNLINQVRGRTELSFYSLYKNIKYEDLGNVLILQILCQQLKTNHIYVGKVWGRAQFQTHNNHI